MRILLLTHSFNSLTQRLFVELTSRGHDVSIEFDINDAVAIEAVRLAKPDLILAPFLKRAIPETIWRNHVCLVVHPGPPGDRGPAALDWAILEGAREWGVTVLQAEAEMDAGPVWASAAFPMRHATKSSLYRNEVTDTAVAAVLQAIAKFPGDGGIPLASGRFRPAMPQQQRTIDWQKDNTATVLRKIRSADGNPGLLDTIGGEPIYLYDVLAATELFGEPGSLLGRHGDAICRATTDGAIWIGHLRRKAPDALKLPASMVLGESFLRLPELAGPDVIRYEESAGVGYLHFPFYNGAMSSHQCEQLRDAFVAATHRDTKVIVLMGGPDFWSNGLHLNVIEASASPADESWRNIVAMDDLCREIITCERQFTIAALHGNAGAGGVFLALSADRVLAREGVVMNAHYKGMGNLYGSEYWTYLLPRRAGAQQAAEVTQARLPMGVAEAKRVGLIDEHFGRSTAEFRQRVEETATALAARADLSQLIATKRERRAKDEALKPLMRYREEELERIKLNFYGFDPSYHVARYNFVRKVPKSRTPLYLAKHRRAAVRV